jgi:hypothetical protein
LFYNFLIMFGVALWVVVVRVSGGRVEGPVCVRCGKDAVQGVVVAARQRVSVGLLHGRIVLVVVVLFIHGWVVGLFFFGKGSYFFD